MRLDTIQIENTTSCNARCTYCPTRAMTRPQGNMDFNLFKKIVAQGKALGIKRFLPFLNGEPFASPDIFEWLDYLESEGVEVHIYTNASLLTREKIDRLVKYKCIDFMRCSIPGAKIETYEKITGLKNYDSTVENVRYLLEKRTFVVRVGMVVTEDTFEERVAFKKLWKRPGKLGLFKNWAGAKQDSIVESGMKYPCDNILRKMTVLWDGRVSQCCFDYDGKVILGDLNYQSVGEIWRNNKLMRMRHKRMDFSMPLCKSCDYNMHSPTSDVL